MSLVSYGASDESDSDAEDGNINAHSRENGMVTMSGHISDDDDFGVSVGSSSTTSAAVAPGIKELENVGTGRNAFSYSAVHDSGSDFEVHSTSVTSLEDLPSPQPRIQTTETKEAELEDEVRPKASEIASAPKPPGKKQKQPVKITIPSLDDEDNDDEKDTKKKSTPSAVKSGLFSLLPAPVHAVKKEANRPLIPHSLVKKPLPLTKIAATSTAGEQSSKNTLEAASTIDISQKRMTPFNALTGYDSDSDDDDDDDKGSTTNFFSLVTDSEVKTVDNISKVSTNTLQSEEVSSSKAELNDGVLGQSLPEKSVENSENKNEQDTIEDKDASPEPGAVNDAPLDFRSVNRLSTWSASSYGFLGPVGLTGPVLQPNPYSSFGETYSLPSSSEYNQANAEVSSEMNDEGSEAVTDDDLKKFMSDKEFHRLQGKRKRGLEEAFNFVDASVDDYVDPSEVTKHLTEETEYVSHKSKDNLPTAQQRRKKQITYLAYQAKERELELKNAWAQNRMTKKQTQSKYGF